MLGGKVVGHCERRRKKNRKGKKGCFPQRTKQRNDCFSWSLRTTESWKETFTKSTNNEPSQNPLAKKSLNKCCLIHYTLKKNQTPTFKIKLYLFIQLLPVKQCKESHQHHFFTTVQSGESLCAQRNVAGGNKE